MTEKSLPENIQDGIIYYLLTDLKFLSICKTKLDPVIFQSTLQQQICKIIFEFFDKHETIINGNADTIILQEFPENEQGIVAVYLNKIFSSTYIKSYIQEKLDLFIQKREWEKALIKCVEDLDNDDIDSIENRIGKVIRNKFSYSDVQNVLEENLKDFYHTRHEGVICSPSGVKALDQVIGGFKYKELAIIVSPLNVGKSWAFTLFGSKALLYGKTVLHLTLEMSRQQVKERYFMRFAGVSSKPMEEINIWSGNEKIKFKPEHLGNANKVKKAIKTMSSFGGKLYIVEYPDKTLTISKLERLLNDMELEQGKYPDLILIDGLQGLRYNEGKRGDDWKALEELTHELRRIMMENTIAGIASTHSQRGAIGNKIIQSQDIRGSIDILNVADLGISINQTNEEQLLGQARLFVMRSRSSKKWAQIRIYQNYDMGHFCVYSELME